MCKKTRQKERQREEREQEQNFQIDLQKKIERIQIAAYACTPTTKLERNYIQLPGKYTLMVSLLAGRRPRVKIKVA